jgi:hypothetical protein
MPDEKYERYLGRSRSERFPNNNNNMNNSGDGRGKDSHDNEDDNFQTNPNLPTENQSLIQKGVITHAGQETLNSYKTEGDDESKNVGVQQSTTTPSRKKGGLKKGSNNPILP